MSSVWVCVSLLLLHGELSSCCELLWGAPRAQALRALSPLLRRSRHALGSLTLLLWGRTYLWPPPHSPRTPDVWLGLSVTPQRPSSSPPGLPVITLERPGDVAPQAFTYLATLPRPHWSPFSYTTLHAPLTLAYFFLILRLSPCPYHLSLSSFAPHSCCKSRHGTCEEALGPPRTFSPETPLPRVCFSPLWGPRSSLAPPCCLSVCLSVCSFPCPSPRAASADGFGPGV